MGRYEAFVPLYGTVSGLLSGAQESLWCLSLSSHCPTAMASLQT